MILRHSHIFAHSSAHTPRTSTYFAPRSGVQAPSRLRTARRVGLLLALLFALVLGNLPADARLVLRRADSLLSPLDTVRLSVVAQRTEYPSDDPADPRPFVVIDFSYPDLSAYTVGTDGSALTAPLDFSATVENRADIALRWCGLTHECTLLSARGESETRRARLTPDVPRLPLELEGHFADSTYGHPHSRRLHPHSEHRRPHALRDSLHLRRPLGPAPHRRPPRADHAPLRSRRSPRRAPPSRPHLPPRRPQIRRGVTYHVPKIAKSGT